jgi:hypothetical protein
MKSLIDKLYFFKGVYKNNHEKKPTTNSTQLSLLSLPKGLDVLLLA